MNRTIGKKGTVSFAQMKNALSGGVKKNNNQNSSSPKKDIDVTMDVRDVLGRIQKNPADSNGSRSTTYSASSKKSTIAMTSRTARESVVMPEQKNNFEKIQEKFFDNPVSSLDAAPKSISRRKSNKSHLASPARMQEKKHNLKNKKSFMDVSDDEQYTVSTSVPKSVRSYKPEVKTAEKKSGKWQEMDGESSESSSSASSPRRDVDSSSSSSTAKPKAEEGNAEFVSTIYKFKSKSKSKSDSDSDKKPKGIVSFRDLKRTLTRKTNSVTLSQTVKANKKASSPESLRKSDAQKVISDLPAKQRFYFARELNDYKNTEEFIKSSMEAKSSMIFIKSGLFLVETGLEFNDVELQKALLKDAGNFKKQIIELDDPVFKDHIQEMMNVNFKAAWDNKKAGEDTIYNNRVVNDEITKAFARDFKAANIFIKQSNGNLKKIDSMEEYLGYASNDEITNMPKIISNIANQTLGISLQSAVFARKKASHTQFEFDSALKLPNGISFTPVFGNGMGQQITYTLEKNSDGSFFLEYKRMMYSQPGNPLRVRTYEIPNNTYDLGGDAVISLYAPITIKPNGDWHIGDVELESFNVKVSSSQ